MVFTDISHPQDGEFPSSLTETLRQSGSRLVLKDLSTGLDFFVYDSLIVIVDPL